LIDAGHDVIGTHNAPASAELLRTLGASHLDQTVTDGLIEPVRKAAVPDRRRWRRNHPLDPPGERRRQDA